jgi:cell division protein FtsZ
MGENTYKFELPTHHKSIIKVIGVGGGGSNAVNHMFNQGIKDVEFVVCNTDAQALKFSPVPHRLQIGINLTSGLGAGANPEVGKNAALESKEDIRNFLSDSTKMVFITAGMGGGTGTGAAPVIAKVAKELDILTVGIVTAPFIFEGKKKIQAAQTGIDQLRESCDTVLVILNDKLREIYGNLPIRAAFAQADNILTTAAKGIAEIITVPGYVNVDFEDVKTVMKNSGAAVMGSAKTEGENRARRAAEEAISSPLLNSKDILGAQKILLSIISGEQAELQMDELTDIIEYIQEKAGEEAEVIFGHGIDPDLKECIRVTIIATGFDNDDFKTIKSEKKKVIDLESNRQISLFNEDEYNQNKAQTRDIEEKKRNYSFQRPTEEENEEKDIFSGLGNEYEIVEREAPVPEAEKPVNEVSMKKESLQKQADERKHKLQGLKNPAMDSDEFKERLEVPAYVRKQYKLQDVVHSSEKNISRYNLTDDNHILGNNKFLHDNVD